MRKRSYYILLFILLWSLKGFAQDYNKAIGVKTGPYWGVNFKALKENERGYEFLVINKNAGLTVKGLTMFHTPAMPKKTSQLFAFYGFGGHLGYYRKKKVYNFFKPYREPYTYRGDIFVFGVDGLVGLEYRFLKYPFTVKMDLQPNFEFLGPNFFNVSFEQAGFTLSYTM